MMMTVRQLLNVTKKEEVVKSLEKAFRALPEYELWSVSHRKYLCEWKDCPFNSDISSLQVHHYPLTLFEIVSEMIDENLELTPYQILGKIIEIHSEDKVDSITLCKHHHAMFHEMVKKNLDPNPFLAGE
jgi:hypothetical protein